MFFGIYLPLHLADDEKSQLIAKLGQHGFNHFWVSDDPEGSNAFLTIDRFAAVNPSSVWWTGVTSPYYYSLPTLTSLLWSVQNRYPNRVGLGISIGDIFRLKEMGVITTSVHEAIKKLDESLIAMKTLWKKYQTRNSSSVPFPQVAIGGLGNQLCRLAARHADYLFLNSSHSKDVDRALNILMQYKSSCHILPLILLELEENPSLFSWYMTIKMLKSAPHYILEARGYDAPTIELIKSYSHAYPKELPIDRRLRQVLQDNIVSGSPSAIIERLGQLKANNVDGMVFRASFTENFWSQISKIIQSIS